MADKPARSNSGLSKFVLNSAVTLLMGLSLTTIASNAAMALPIPTLLPVWDETANGGGDAGSRLDPQLLTGGVGTQYGGISGTIGRGNVFPIYVNEMEGPGLVDIRMEVDDVIDVYGFSFAGGTFSASMCVDCLMGIVFPLPYVQEDKMVHEIIMLPPGLFTIALFNDDFSVMFDSATGSILELISIEAELAAGNYFLEITTGADDPPFTVTTSLIGAFQVAEPNSLAILGLSLLALGLARRRRKTIA